MYIFHEIRDRLQRLFGSGRFKSTRVRRYLLGALFFALLTAILAAQLGPQRINVRVGDVAPRNVEAPREIINTVETRRLKALAAEAVPTLQELDLSVLEQSRETVSYAFTQIRDVAALPNQEIQTKTETLAFRLNLGDAVPMDTFRSLLELSPIQWQVAREDALRLTDAALSGRVGRADIADLRFRIDREAEGFALQSREAWLKLFIKELVKRQVRTNLVDDPVQTAALRQQAMDEVPDVVWKKGQLILRKSEIVTPEQYAALEELRVVGRDADVRAILGAGLFSLLMIALITVYLRRTRPDIADSDGKLMLLGSIGIVTLLLALLMKSFSEGLGPGVAYLMPISVNAMLIAILLDPKIALLQSVVLTLMVGMATEFVDVSHVMVAIVGSAAAVYMVARIESRTDIYRAGLMVSGVHVVAILAAYLMHAFTLLDLQVWIDAGLGALNGVVVAVVVTGALPLFESLFGIVTPLKLLELSNPNHPLLKKLLVEAPGSYHHTILVANLCEAAAEAIGADQVLARVGAYYHDIGKTKRPYFFVENQFGMENPHDKLPPSLSALIITSHVKDGLEMANEAGLPREIVDFIPEHHGTMLVSYFYYMASKTGGSEYVLEDDFRYEGPKPRSKETAICMLADGCEASVRAMRQKGPLTVDQIEAQVQLIISDRLKQGQLEECDLTFRHLDTISKTFVKVLSGVHHARIEYPPEANGSRLVEATAPPQLQTGEEEPDGTLDQQRTDADSADAPAGGADPAGGEPKPDGGSPGTGG